MVNIPMETCRVKSSDNSHLEDISQVDSNRYHGALRRVVEKTVRAVCKCKRLTLKSERRKKVKRIRLITILIEQISLDFAHQIKVGDQLYRLI